MSGQHCIRHLLFRTFRNSLTAIVSSHPTFRPSIPPPPAPTGIPTVRERSRITRPSRDHLIVTQTHGSTSPGLWDCHTYGIVARPSAPRTEFVPPQGILFHLFRDDRLAVNPAGIDGSCLLIDSVAFVGRHNLHEGEVPWPAREQTRVIQARPTKCQKRRYLEPTS